MTTGDIMLKLTNRHLLKTECYIDGKWQRALDGKTIAVLNPATGEKIAEVPQMGTAEALQAVEAAKKAFNIIRAINNKISVVKI